jgi:hypothetical protein
MIYLKNSLIIILMLLILSSVTFIQAQSSDSTGLPSIGKHIFTSIAGVEDPFIKTKFILSIGLANLIETEIPVTVPSINKTIMFKPQLFYTVGGIEYQHAVNDWAAIHIKAGGLARVGNNAVSIATQGISAASFFNIGLLFKLAENDKLSLAGGLDLNTSSLTYIDLAGKFEDIVSDSSTTKQVINNYSILSGIMHFRFALKFSDVLGLLANASGSFGEIYAKASDNNLSWAFGTLLSVDLRNWIHIPFGIGFGGTVISNDWQYSESDKPIYTVNLNIAFINQNDFAVGLENYIQMVEEERYNKTFNFQYSRIYLSYYF